MNSEIHQNRLYDVCVVGSGFAGSLLAWILAHQGRRVVMIDRSRHPRFAIGESSTPLADFLLERIADQFNLPQLRPLSHWGSWQQHYPQLGAGKKRGFSYFAHRKGESFSESPSHDASLLVAASVSDAVSDTHWMRADVDQWLCNHAVAAGAELLEGFTIEQLEAESQNWHIQGSTEPSHTQHAANNRVSIASRFLVDASGGGAVLGKTLGLKQLDSQLRTQTGALFGHFQQVGSMHEWFTRNGLTTSDDPFNSDDAAQHHLLGKHSWVWMLRFAEGTTSVGLVQAADQWPSSLHGTPSAAARQAVWDSVVANYPTLAELMSKAKLVAPSSKQVPALGWIPRIGRLWSSSAGMEGTRCGWAMLPGTVGIVDPLHSTGIAHGLSGVLRLARLLCDNSENPSAFEDGLKVYSQQLVEEVQWIDRIVHCCYMGLRDSFELFTAMCSLYFVAAIHSERQMHATGNFRDGFLLKDSTALQQIVESADQRLRAQEPGTITASWLKEALKPWNDVGLMDQALNNRIARSSAPK